MEKQSETIGYWIIMVLISGICGIVVVNMFPNHIFVSALAAGVVIGIIYRPIYEKVSSWLKRKT